MSTIRRSNKSALILAGVQVGVVAETWEAAFVVKSFSHVLSNWLAVTGGDEA